MRLHQRSISKVSLLNVLKRRKTDLKRFLEEAGIVTYELLKSRCDSMGVIPPDEQEFLDASGTSHESAATISSPAEGVIVLEPPKIINELTGKEVTMPEDEINDVILPVKQDELEESNQEDSSQKKKKKKTT